MKILGLLATSAGIAAATTGTEWQVGPTIYDPNDEGVELASLSYSLDSKVVDDHVVVYLVGYRVDVNPSLTFESTENIAWWIYSEDSEQFWRYTFLSDGGVIRREIFKDWLGYPEDLEVTHDPAFF